MTMRSLLRTSERGESFIITTEALSNGIVRLGKMVSGKEREAVERVPSAIALSLYLSPR